MRPIIDQDTVQIEITNNCQHRCSNCTRFVGHHEKPYYMSFEMFKEAVDSLINFPKMIGVMGGEPLLHPEFEKMCEYLASKIPPERCGLWSCFPNGFEKYREIICKTFGNIFLNDQGKNDILHAPLLVSSCELKGMEQWTKDYLINQCWVQNSWSASINPNGAFFCEVAAALALLLDLGGGWDVTTTPEWWTKVPKDFVSQMETYCKLCGAAMPLRKRSSCEGADDISPEMFERLKDSSPKIKAHTAENPTYQIHDGELVADNRQVATYKDPEYRENIAARYGIFLTVNEKNFNKPNLRKERSKQNEVNS